MAIEPLPCAFKRGRKHQTCEGTPVVHQMGFGGPQDHFARCDRCKSATGLACGPANALAEWNRWMEIENRHG